MFGWLKNRKRQTQGSAAQAKERLSMVIAVANEDGDAPDWLPAMKAEIVEVISRYVKVNKERIVVDLERQGEMSIIDLSIAVDLASSEGGGKSDTLTMTGRQPVALPAVAGGAAGLDSQKSAMKGELEKDPGPVDTDRGQRLQ